MTGTTITTTIANLDDLIKLLNASDTILRYNSSIEDSINKNGGTVIYSYNNVIIASEISEPLYITLKNNPYIEYIESLPLKKYGDVDTGLIDQLDISKVFIGETINANGTIGMDGTSGSLRISSGTNEIDGKAL